ncbi:MFS transporter [Thermaurantiacus sp.]
MRVQPLRLLAWCGPCLPLAALGLPLVVYLPPYYAGTLGLPLGVVGFLFALVRIIDIPLDPLFGAGMDQTRSRFGQFRPWLFAGALVLMGGVFLLFMERPGVSPEKAFLNLFVLFLGYSMTFLAQTSWGSRLSPDYAERARIFGWWTAFNVLGTILVLLIPPLVGGLDAKGGQGAGVQAMGWFIILMLPLTMAATVLLVPEGKAAAPPHGISLSAARDLLLERRMLKLLALDLMLAAIPAVAGALFLFMFTQVKGFTAQQTSVLLLFYFVAGLAAAPLWIRAAARFGKHKAVAAAAAGVALAQLGVLAIPEGNMVLGAIGMGVAGLPFAAPGFLLRSMLADLNDALLLDRRRAGADARDTTGLSFALLTATAKLGYAAPVGLLYPLLGLFGFDPSPTASNEGLAITGLILVFVVPPLIFGAISLWLAWTWPIDARAHAAIRAELADGPA